MKQQFKVGDKIRVTSDCGNQKRGMILTVQQDKSEGLYVKINDCKLGDSPHGCCSCIHTWEFVSHAEIFDWRSEFND